MLRDSTVEPTGCKGRYRSDPKEGQLYDCDDADAPDVTAVQNGVEMV